MSNGSGVVSLVRSLLHASSLALESGCAGGMLNQMLILFLQEVPGCFCTGQEDRQTRSPSFSCRRLEQTEMQPETCLWFILSQVTRATRNVRLTLRFAYEGADAGVARQSVTIGTRMWHFLSWQHGCSEKGCVPSNIPTEGVEAF